MLVDISLWTPAPHSPSSPTPTVSLRVLPSLSTQDMKITGQWFLQYLDDVPNNTTANKMITNIEMFPQKK